MRKLRQNSGTEDLSQARMIIEKGYLLFGKMSSPAGLMLYRARV